MTKEIPQNKSQEQFPYNIGLLAVIEELKLSVSPPATHSSIIAGARRTRVENSIIYEQYPKNYSVEGLFENLKFALRYEPIDLGVLKAAFEKIDTKHIAEWVRSEPTGIYARKLWYLYELLTGQILALPDVPPTGNVDLVNSQLQLTGNAVSIKRQRVIDNLLGNREYCPFIRRTETLDALMLEELDRETRTIVEETDPVVLSRAISYLYTQETKSSFAIEGEVIAKGRSVLVVSALERAAEFDPTETDSLVDLQSKIVDPRFSETGWREVQNYVGQTISDYTEQVHFVCPKPEDVASLMAAWMGFTERLQASDVHPVCAAAAMSFGFVFIHPFEDGNGRIHRFLIHQQLASTGFAPSKLVFPVSSVMLRERLAYDSVLEGFSKSILPFIEYYLSDKGVMTVENRTADSYRYWDATAFAEFLFHCVKETIRRDLREELGFLVIFDEALRAVREIFDMPDPRASLLVRLILQNRAFYRRLKDEASFPK